MGAMNRIINGVHPDVHLEKGDAVYIKNITCYFAGKKAPAGAHPGAPSLESHCLCVQQIRT